jgi:hypothetical protein
LLRFILIVCLIRLALMKLENISVVSEQNENDHHLEHGLETAEV